MNKVVITLFALSAVASWSVFAKGDVAAGQSRSVACATCHGPVGVSPTDAWPSLAAQGYSYLVKQMKAYREGARKDLLMEQMAKSLSDEDIENLAAFYSAQKGLSPGTPSAGARVAPAGNAAAPAASVPHSPIMASDIIMPRAHTTRQYWADKLPQDEGRALVIEKCQLCHDFQRTIAFARPKEQWQEVVESMVRRGTPLTAGEIPVAVNYFTKYFGMDSPTIDPEVGMKPCKPSDWPKGSSDFRSNWKGPYNIWLSNQQGGNIDIVDPVTKKIVRRIGCVSAPDRVEFSRDGNTAYAPDRVEHNVTVIDTRTGAIKAKIPLVARPNTSTLSRDYKKLYVAIWPVRGDEDKRGYVQIIDTTSLKVIKTIETKGGIHDPWMSPDGKIVLAMSPSAKFMNVYDTKTDNLLYTCCTDSDIGTMNVEAAPDGSTSRFFISYVGFNGVVAIDAKTGKETIRVLHPVDTEGPSKGVRHLKESRQASGFHGGEISPDGTYWVMQGSYVYKYELPSLKGLGDVHLSLVDQVGKPFAPAGEGTWMTIAPDGQKLYAVRPGRNLLSVVDVKSMKEEALIPTGEYPLHISIWPRGTP